MMIESYTSAQSMRVCQDGTENRLNTDMQRKNRTDLVILNRRACHRMDIQRRRRSIPIESPSSIFARPGHDYV